MLAFRWSHLIFFLFLSPFLFLHFAMFFQLFVTKMTSNGDGNADFASKRSDRRTKRVYCNKVEFSKNSLQVSANF